MSDTTETHAPVFRETAARLRVSYGEVDRMGVAYYGNYLRWFEIARAEYLRARGKTYKEIEAEGTLLPVIEAHVRYRRSAAYDDLLEIWAVPGQVDRVRITFNYRIVRPEDGALIAEGYTTHACLNATAGRVGRMPQPLLDLLAVVPDPRGG